MSMTTHLKQKGLVLHQECSIPRSSNPMLPFRLMRIIFEMLHHYWKDLLTNRHFMTLTSKMVCSQRLELPSLRFG